MIHPLMRCFHDVVKERYGHVLWTDPNPERTETIATRVNRLGISYEVFISLAVNLCDAWVNKHSHPYPFWNMVTSDMIFERIIRYLKLLNDVDVDEGEVDHEYFLLELEHAQAYIGWMIGELDHKPARLGIAVPMAVKVAVAEYVCVLRGIPCLSSNLNIIAEEIKCRQTS